MVRLWQDLLVASLFRNLLLAERIMRGAGCTPLSQPRLPPTHQHPMWLAWDLAAEMCLLQLPRFAAANTALASSLCGVHPLYQPRPMRLPNAAAYMYDTAITLHES